MGRKLKIIHPSHAVFSEGLCQNELSHGAKKVFSPSLGHLHLKLYV